MKGDTSCPRCYGIGLITKCEAVTGNGNYIKRTYTHTKCKFDRKN